MLTCKGCMVLFAWFCVPSKKGGTQFFCFLNVIVYGTRTIFTTHVPTIRAKSWLAKEKARSAARYQRQTNTFGTYHLPLTGPATSSSWLKESIPIPALRSYSAHLPSSIILHVSQKTLFQLYQIIWPLRGQSLSKLADFGMDPEAWSWLKFQIIG